MEIRLRVTDPTCILVRRMADIRAGLVEWPKSVYAQTADGPRVQASGQFGENVVAVSLKNSPLWTYTLLGTGNRLARRTYAYEKGLDIGSVSRVKYWAQRIGFVVVLLVFRHLVRIQQHPALR